MEWKFLDRFDSCIEAWCKRQGPYNAKAIGTKNEVGMESFWQNQFLHFTVVLFTFFTIELRNGPSSTSKKSSGIENTIR